MLYRLTEWRASYFEKIVFRLILKSNLGQYSLNWLEAGTGVVVEASLQVIKISKFVSNTTEIGGCH